MDMYSVPSPLHRFGCVIFHFDWEVTLAVLGRRPPTIGVGAYTVSCYLHKRQSLPTKVPRASVSGAPDLRSDALQSWPILVIRMGTRCMKGRKKGS
ncbi:unnamed protein product [Protopolystoma xenopodis]|uniref:Uncharacterized protein n=1 Tax=Protopolystoma xenopodis TaxID=117903 RepID=A0A448XJM6_9PLAT|nr:unnamed protein product [Protopolystoma xenopodis]